MAHLVVATCHVFKTLSK